MIIGNMFFKASFCGSKPANVSLQNFCFMESKWKKKEAMEVITFKIMGMHVNVLHMFELQSGVSIDKTH